MRVPRWWPTRRQSLDAMRLAHLGHRLDKPGYVGVLCTRDLRRLRVPGRERRPGVPGTPGHPDAHPLWLAGGHTGGPLAGLSTSSEALPFGPRSPWRSVPPLPFSYAARSLYLLCSHLYWIRERARRLALGDRPDRPREPLLLLPSVLTWRVPPPVSRPWRASSASPSPAGGSWSSTTRRSSPPKPSLTLCNR